MPQQPLLWPTPWEAKRCRIGCLLAKACALYEARTAVQLPLVANIPPLAGGCTRCVAQRPKMNGRDSVCTKHNTNKVDLRLARSSIATYTLPTPSFRTAGWASLPPDVSEQILGTDEEAMYCGSKVCKAWHRAASSCNVRSILLSPGIPLTGAIEVLNRNAGPACTALQYQPDNNGQYAPETLRTIFTDVLPCKFCQLQALDLYIDKKGSWDLSHSA